MHRIFNNLISVIYSFIRFFMLKIVCNHAIYFNGIQRFSPNVSIEIERGGILSLGKKIRVHSGGKFKIRAHGRLVIEDNVSFNYNCMIFCHEQIIIRKGVEFGPGVLIYDHDHDYKAKGGIKEGKFTTKCVEIGENTWIGANTVLLKGSKIGKNCVIGAGSVIKGNIPDNSLVIQKRNTEIKQWI